MTQEANKAKARAAFLSVGSNVVLVVLKFVVGFATGSAAIVSEGAHSLSDLFAASLALFAVRKAAEPADALHPFGHGKYESISGFSEGLIIMLAAAGIIANALRKLLHNNPVERLGWGLAIMGLSAVANVLVSNHLRSVAERTDSVALQADSEHIRTDVLTSVGVFLGLALEWYTRWQWVDPVVAIVVALAIVLAGGRILVHALDHLLDRALPAEEEAAIQRLLEEHAGQFVEFHELRTRKSGSDRHIDLHLVMDGSITLQQAHDLADHLEHDLMELLPNAQIIIHPEPHSEALNGRTREAGP